MFSLRTRKKIAAEAFAALDAAYPGIQPSLNFSSAWELLVGGILGAQTTDVRVNAITAVMFREMPEIRDYAVADILTIEGYIKTAGLYHNKAKALKGAAEMIISHFGGEVPRSLTELTQLPGVGRKVANLVMGDFYGIPGMVVDTHNGRISKLLGLTDSENPTIVERHLCEAIPPEHWVQWGHLMVEHGRAICRARCRSCAMCPARSACVFAKKHRAAISRALNSNPAGCIAE